MVLLLHKAGRGLGGLACALLAGNAAADVTSPLNGASLGGSLALTSDYIYQGISESAGHPAVQADLHLAARAGTFAGVWGSSRDHSLEPGGSAVVELYLGQHIDLGSAWSATLAARTHEIVGGTEASDDYQALTGTLTYLDRWSVSVTAIPNAVRYWFYLRLPRRPAWVAETSGQWPLSRQLLLTAGAGYYHSSGSGPGIERSTGYLYGNAGLAVEKRAWRLDVGYFFVQDAAQRSFPYPPASHIAATLAWRF